MAQMKYSDLQAMQAETPVGNNLTGKPRVGYFSLQNDGDVAIVRIMHDTPDTFEIVSVHSTYVDGKFRKINCLREVGDPINKCPMCVKDAEKGGYPSKRIYIHMIQYVKDENGTVVATPVVWDRPAKRYCDKLISIMQEYGNLSDLIVKIKRNGASGDQNTDYDVFPANQQIYPSNIYVKDDTLFDGYSVLNGAVLSKSFDELDYFVKYDSFPVTDENGNTNTNGWGGAQTAQSGFRPIPNDVEEGIPFDSPEAQKLQEEVVNELPQWNVTPKQTQTYANPYNNAPNGGGAMPKPVRQY